MADGAPWRRVMLKRPFQHLGGHQFFSHLDPAAAGPPDEAAFPERSRLRVWEAGKLLEGAHSSHEALETRGAGRFSHWRDGLRFSSSDGSDPNQNGRLYSFDLAPARPIVLTMGACHLQVAAELLEQRGAILRAEPTLASLNTTPEMRQLLNVCLEGDGTLGPFCAGPREWGPDLWKRLISEAELVALEIGAPLAFELNGYVLNPSKIKTELVEPAEKISETVCSTVGRWYHIGLLRQDEAVRIAEGEKLLGLLGPETPQWAAEVVRGARVRTQSFAEVAGDLAWIRSVVRKPILVTSTSVGYTARGKPFGFTPNFFKRLSDTCAAQDIRVMHPHVLVAEMGAARALKEDRWHFSDEGIAAYADLLWENLSALAR